MNTPSWISALGLFMTYPVLIVASFLIACAAFGFAWFLRGHWAKDRIAVLEERLRLAQDNHASIKQDVERLQTQVGEQTNIISVLRSTVIGAPQLDRLDASNTAAQLILSNLSHSTTDLGVTVTIVGGKYDTAASIPFSAFKKST